jgi:XTP/dITP diphosphohydrolase
MPDPLSEFAEVVRLLRARCPWKAAQTHESLVRYLTEEAAETIEAIETSDAEGLKEELGDLLFQVFMHAAIAEEQDVFTLDEVAQNVTEKMYRRNPHVFNDEPESTLTPAEVNARWEAIKRSEKVRVEVTEGLPAQLPALLYAQKVLERLNFPAESGAKVASDVDLGNQLLDLVNQARNAGLDAEQVLRQAVRRRIDAQVVE